MSQKVQYNGQSNGTTTKTATATTITTQNRSRRKVEDFNDIITCSLCHGYLIEATSINECLHTYCRSCIVKYLDTNKNCPKCKSYNGKPITFSNLRSDTTIRAIVYKLVPGLYQSEYQRIIKHKQGDTKGPCDITDGNFPENESFFAPDEPISLSLEYHFESIIGYEKTSTPVIPITYLQCPAAVTIRHLYKFILSKNGFHNDNSNVQVDIIYRTNDEDEVIPTDFSLMDVAYCYHWIRVSPMRLFYRIFIHSSAKPASTEIKVDVVKVESTPPEIAKATKEESNNINFNTVADDKVSNTSNTINYTISSTKSSNSNKIEDLSRESLKMIVKTNNNNNSNNISSNSINEAKIVVKPSANESVPETRETLKLVIKKNDTNSSSNSSNSDSKSKSSRNGPSYSLYPSTPTSTLGSISSDFKRLRSNDMKFGDFDSPSTSMSSTKIRTNNSKTGTVTVDDSKKSDSHQNNKKLHKTNSSNNDVNDDEKITVKRSNSEPEKSPDIKLKIETKMVQKCYVNLRKQTTSNKPEVPKLKIELPSLRKKLVTSPSSPEEKDYDALIPKVDLKEYAKNIGLRPVTPEERRVHEKKHEPKGEEEVERKKKKKSKHSKEPGSKKRKLHAEISEVDESLKIKVKLTPKPDRKQSEDSATPPKPKIVDITKEKDEEKASKSKDSKEKINEMRAVRHKPMVCIPNVSLNITEDNSIDSLIQSVQKVAEEKPKPSQSPVKFNNNNPILLPPTPTKLLPQSLVNLQAQKLKQQQSQNKMFSPPHVPNYPPLNFHQPPRFMPTSPAVRGLNPTGLKRSISLESSSTSAPLPPKTPRVDFSEMSDQSRQIKKPVYAPMFAMARKPESKPPVYYKSPMGSAYTTTQENSNQKPLPILVPQSSISVTKLSDSHSPPTTTIDTRPALEIVRIPSTAAVADKPMITPISSMAQKPVNKTTRPPPATIPLIKIRKSAQQNQISKSEPSSGVLDLSGKSVKSCNGKSIEANGHNNNLSSDNKDDKLKANMEMTTTKSRNKINNDDHKLELISSPTIGTTTSANSSDSLSAKICQANKMSMSYVTGQISPTAKMPKLQEINKIRAASMRTQSSSVRMIPNPSALVASRNQSNTVLPIKIDNELSSINTPLSPSIGKKNIETVAAGLKASASTVNVV